MSDSSLGLTGLLADLLEDEKNAASPSPSEYKAEEKAEPCGNAVLQQPGSVACASSLSAEISAVDAELQGLLSGMNLSTAALVNPDSYKGEVLASCNWEHSSGKLAGASCVHASAESVPCPWNFYAGGKGMAMVSFAEDANSEFRNYMEDGHRIIDPILVRGRGNSESWSFFAVYDGHGGRSEVEHCERQLHEVVLAELQDPQRCKDVRHVLETTFQKIDSQLAMLGGWDSGCTATVALLHRQQGSKTSLYVANVGDSRAVLLGESGVQRLSKDHHPDDPSEALRIKRDGGTVHNRRVGGKLIVSRSLGDHHLKGHGLSCIPDVASVDVTCGHVLVIASDGLWDAVSDDDAQKLIQACIDSAKQQTGGEQAANDWLRDNAARTLVQRAKERGSRDNILALVIFL